MKNFERNETYNLDCFSNNRKVNSAAQISQVSIGKRSTITVQECLSMPTVIPGLPKSIEDAMDLCRKGCIEKYNRPIALGFQISFLNKKTVFLSGPVRLGSQLLPIDPYQLACQDTYAVFACGISQG